MPKRMRGDRAGAPTIADVPERVLHIIFSYVPAASCFAPREVACLLLVSKGWLWSVQSSNPSVGWACHLCDDDLLLMAMARSLPTVAALNLRDNGYITNAGLRSLNALPGLRDLNLREMHQITDGVSALTLPKLESLNLVECLNLTDEALVNLRAFPALKTLNLWFCVNITLKAFDGFSPLLTCLHTLILRGCTEITDGATAQCALLPGLRVLDLGWCHITDAGLWPLTATDVTHLDLDNNMVTDDGLRALVHMHGLTELRLSGNTAITDRGLLDSLAQIKGLQLLKMCSCDNITDEGVRGLTKLGSLRFLSLLGCINITDEGVRALATMTGLVRLSLGYRKHTSPEHMTEFRITDAGVQSLTTLIHLRELKVRGACSVTDASVRALVTLPSLRALAMPHSPNLTAEGLRSLFAAPWLRKLTFDGCDNLCLTDQGSRPDLTDLYAFLNQRTGRTRVIRNFY